MPGPRLLARRAPRWLAPEQVSTRPLFGKRGRIVAYRPHGVVGIISPWNAPLNLALGDAVPALLAGNAVIIKPSELTPLGVRRAVEAMQPRAAGRTCCRCVIGAGETGAALVDHVDMICVTGSPETGRRVMERASRRLTPVLLELGGKDPMIVLRDADLDRAASAAAWGGCMMTGQVCMSVERVYVEAPVAEAFTREARRADAGAARRTERRAMRRSTIGAVHQSAPDRDRRAPRRRRARQRRARADRRHVGAATDPDASTSRRCWPASTTRMLDHARGDVRSR